MTSTNISASELDLLNPSFELQGVFKDYDAYCRDHTIKDWRARLDEAERIKAQPDFLYMEFCGEAADWYAALHPDAEPLPLPTPETDPNVTAQAYGWFSSPAHRRIFEHNEKLRKAAPWLFTFTGKKESKGRKPATVSPMPAVDTTPTETAAELVVDDLRARNVPMTKEQLEVTLQVSQRIGAIQQASFFEVTSRVAMLTHLKQIKDGKLYKGLNVPTRDGLIVTQTWADFCRAIDMSPSKVDEDLLNLTTFGGNLLEMQETLGLGYRDLRAMRAGLTALDPAERDKTLAEIQAAAESGDAEELKAAIADLTIERRQQEKRLKDLQADLDARQKLLSRRTQELSDAALELEKFKAPGTPDQEQENLLQRRSNFRAVLVHELCEVEKGLRYSCLRVLKLIREADPMLDAEFMEDINRIFASVCQGMGNAIREAEIEVDFSGEFEPLLVSAEGSPDDEDCADDAEGAE